MITAATASAPAERIRSIDVLRGVVMVLMAIDHVRVFSGLPSGGPAPAIFFTRWVTHFCAPLFLFLAGTSAFLYCRRHTDLPRFLLTRGIWLVFLELTVIRLSWTFNVDYAHYMLAGVIWVIGWSMIVMSLLVRLPVWAVGSVGIAIAAGHNLIDPFLPRLMPSLSSGPFAWFWKLLYLGFYVEPIHLGSSSLVVLYTLVPWVGVMAAGYAFGTVMVAEPAKRRRICLIVGCSAIALFLILRGFNLYGDPRPWGVVSNPNAPRPPALLAFLNTTKYPASLDFLLMTLGPAIAVMPALDNAAGPVIRWLTVFGRVPFFFYMLHIPLIHALALAVSRVRLGSVHPWLFTNHPMGNPPAPSGYMWNLPTLYLIWAVVIVLLYFPCRWFAGVRAGRTDWWLRYW